MSNNQEGNLDQTQFEALHHRYRHRLLKSMTGIVKNQVAAEDITDSAFATAFEKRTDFRGEASAYTWLYRIAANEALDYLRRHKTVSLESLTDEPKALTECDNMTAALEKSEHCRRLTQAMQSVPALYRWVLIDHFVNGYRVKHIAKREGIPVGTVLSRIFKAKRLLRAAWVA